MVDRSDPFDARMRDIARAALREAAADVDTDAAFQGERMSPSNRAPIDDEPPLRRGRRQRWTLIAAAAAVLGMIAAGLVVGDGGNQGVPSDRVPPATSPRPVDTVAPTIPSSDPATTEVLEAGSTGHAGDTGHVSVGQDVRNA